MWSLLHHDTKSQTTERNILSSQKYISILVWHMHTPFGVEQFLWLQSTLDSSFCYCLISIVVHSRLLSMQDFMHVLFVKDIARSFRISFAYLCCDIVGRCALLVDSCTCMVHRHFCNMIGTG